MIRLALLGDPHLHDPTFGRGPGAAPLFRSLRETMESTRVFNESGPALVEVLRRIAAEDIKLCVIVGDLTDDGQPANWAAVSQLLTRHSQEHGTRFFACPGNHDQWALVGRPLAKEFVDAAGRTFVLSGQSGAGGEWCDGMRTAGYAEELTYASGFGYQPDPRDLLWETPFGTAPELASRISTITAPDGRTVRIPDLSYLVEPVVGLWLLSLDANVYVPGPAGGFTDCSKDGWTVTLQHKPYLLPWIEQVVARADAGRKHLVAFSHYPAVDLFGGTIAELAALPGAPITRRHMPPAFVAHQIAATGLGLHLSGHWHVDAISARAGLVNVALPSPVGFPAGWKVLELHEGRTKILDRPLREVPGFAAAAARYRDEARRTGQTGELARSDHYSQFLDHHFRNLVLQRRLLGDWPAALRPLLFRRVVTLLPDATSLPSDCVELATTAHPAREPGCSRAVQNELDRLTVADLLVDWYRLREWGGNREALGVSRRGAYAAILPMLARAAADTHDPVATLFRTFAQHFAAGEIAKRITARLGEPAGFGP